MIGDVGLRLEEENNTFRIWRQATGQHLRCFSSASAVALSSVMGIKQTYSWEDSEWA